jgi:heat shock protein HslJ
MMMNRRFGLAAAFAMLAATTLAAFDANAQGRMPMPSREELGKPAPAPITPQEKTFPFGAAWSASTMNGRSIASMRATLLVDSNLRGTGFGGCNTFSAAAYPLRQQGFAVGPLALTKRSCDQAVSGFERSYLTALRGARKWDLVQGRLVISTASGDLVFERAL